MEAEVNYGIVVGSDTITFGSGSSTSSTKTVVIASNSYGFYVTDGTIYYNVGTYTYSGNAYAVKMEGTSAMTLYGGRIYCNNSAEACFSVDDSAAKTNTGTWNNASTSTTYTYKGDSSYSISTTYYSYRIA